MQPTRPEVASVPWKLNETGCVYQSPWSGGRLALAPTAGSVPSYFSESVTSVLLPARSLQPPWTFASALSGPSYVTVSHDAIPDWASSPWNLKTTGWLYQPSLSGPRLGVPSTFVGGVVSKIGSPRGFAASTRAGAGERRHHDGHYH